MKKFLIALLFSIITLLTLALITSLVVSYLQCNLDIKINQYLIQAISIVMFFISGCVFCLINKKQGLIGATIFILVYVIFSFICNLIFKTNITNSFYFLFIIGKCLAYTIGSILCVNLRHLK